MIATLRIRPNGLLRANESDLSQVAIDGYCTRKNAERMMVRDISGLFFDRISQFGWHHGNIDYRPEDQIFLFFGIFIYKGVLL